MDNITIVAQDIEMIPTGDLIPYVNNSKLHPDDQVALLCGLIREFGFTTPILINAHNSIIAGHGRLQAAQKLRMEKVPCIRATHLTDLQIQALIIADNKIGETGWDTELLSIELQGIKDADPDLLALTAFNFEEIDALIDGVDEEDFAGDSEDSDSDATVAFLTFGSKRLEISDKELALLTAKLDEHMNDFGTAQGFVTRTLFS